MKEQHKILMKQSYLLLSIIFFYFFWSSTKAEFGDVTNIFSFTQFRDGGVEYQSINEKNERETLALYRGFYEEGKNLQQECKKNYTLNYNHSWQKTQVLRTLYANLQMMLLEKSISTLPAYSKLLNLTDSDFEQLVQNLTDQYCSDNISVMSKKLIKLKMKNNFTRLSEEEANKTIPHLRGGKYFPEKYSLSKVETQSIENELESVLRIFISACSWNGEYESPMLMAPFVKHPTIMAHIIRKMVGEEMIWDNVSNKLFLRTNTSFKKKSNPIFCDKQICRQTIDDMNLEEMLPKSEGGPGLAYDLRRLYCLELRDVRSLDGGPDIDADPRLVAFNRSLNDWEINLLNVQAISLFTGMPNFYGRMLNEKNAINDLRKASLGHVFNQWAKRSLDFYSKQLFYEEPLALELVNRNLYQDFKQKKFKLVFDLNVGEFDRELLSHGKLKVDFKLMVKNSFLDYYVNFLGGKIGEITTAEMDRMKNRLKLQIEGSLEKIRAKFFNPPWKGDLALLIAEEITEQINIAPSGFLNFDPTPGAETPVEISFNYGIFALKYFSDSMPK